MRTLQVRITRAVRVEGKEYYPPTVADFVDSTARHLIEMGFGERSRPRGKKRKGYRCPECMEYRARQPRTWCSVCEHEEDLRRKRLQPHHDLERKKEQLVRDFEWKRSDHKFTWPCLTCKDRGYDPYWHNPYKARDGDDLLRHLRFDHKFDERKLKFALEPYLNWIATSINRLEKATRRRERDPIDRERFAAGVFDLRNFLKLSTGSTMREIFHKWPPWVCEVCLGKPVHFAAEHVQEMAEHLQTKHKLGEDEAWEECTAPVCERCKKKPAHFSTLDFALVREHLEKQHEMGGEEREAAFSRYFERSLAHVLEGYLKGK